MRIATPYSSFAGAALFAQASRVFKTWDPNKADDYLKRAVRAYDYAVKHSDENGSRYCRGWARKRPTMIRHSASMVLCGRTDVFDHRRQKIPR